MANVKVCDRCGKEIEMYRNGAAPIFATRYRTVLRREKLYTDDVFDLCGDCTEELYKFLRKEGRE